jgi:hypothetical protein
MGGSLMSNSATFAKRGSLQGQVSVKLNFFAGPGAPVDGYSAVRLIPLSAGPSSAWLLDFPCSFAALTSASVDNQGQDHMALFAHIGSALQIFNPAVESYEIKWFCDLSAFTVPELLPGHTRVWFAYQDVTGAPISPQSVFMLELIFAKSVASRPVGPLPP